MNDIKIIYKSGATIDIVCDDITVSKRGSTLAKLEWENTHPRPLFVGIDDIAAIWDYGASVKDEDDEPS